MDNKFCVRCGSELRENSKFCDLCGARWKLPKNHKSEPLSEPVTEPTHKKRSFMPYILLTVLSLVMLAVIVILVIKVIEGPNAVSTLEGNSVSGKDLTGTWTITYEEDSLWENEYEASAIINTPRHSRSHLIIKMEGDSTGQAKDMQDEDDFVILQHATMLVNYEDGAITMTADDAMPSDEFQSGNNIKLMGAVSLKDGIPYMQGVCYTRYMKVKDNKFYTTFGRFTAIKLQDK